MKYTDGKVCCICGEFDDEIDDVDELIKAESGRIYCKKHFDEEMMEEEEEE